MRMDKKIKENSASNVFDASCLPNITFAAMLRIYLRNEIVDKIIFYKIELYTAHIKSFGEQ